MTQQLDIKNGSTENHKACRKCVRASVFGKSTFQNFINK